MIKLEGSEAEPGSLWRREPKAIVELDAFFPFETPFFIIFLF